MVRVLIAIPLVFACSFAEAQETAVVYGMPGAVVRAGLAQKVLPLPHIAEYLAAIA